MLFFQLQNVLCIYLFHFASVLMLISYITILYVEQRLCVFFSYFLSWIPKKNYTHSPVHSIHSFSLYRSHYHTHNTYVHTCMYTHITGTFSCQPMKEATETANKNNKYRKIPATTVTTATKPANREKKKKKKIWDFFCMCIERLLVSSPIGNASPFSPYIDIVCIVCEFFGFVAL